MKRVSSILVAVLAGLGLHGHAHADILGTAGGFAVLGGSTVTNTGPTIISGYVGLWPGSAMTGFPPGVVIGGTQHLGNPIAQQAQGDVTTAYNALAAMIPTETLSGQDLGGMTITPGVYFFATSAGITGTVTLDAQGDPNAMFVFQIGSTLTTSTDSAVLTINGADGCNVYWQVGSSATLGTNSAFEGNILALTSITLTTGASIVDGRALARNGVISMDSNAIATGSVSKIAPSVAQLNAQFGASVAGARDLNGDGRGDMIVGAPEHNFASGFVAAGRVQIHNGFNGGLIHTINPPNMQPGGRFGASVAGLENVNGDAAGDILVGAPRQHPGATPLNAGRAYIFSGVTGVLFRAIKSPNEQAGSLFGWSVAGVADVNADGRTDYLVSAPGETVGSAIGAGRVYLFSGFNGNLLRTFRSPVFETGGNFGWSVAGVPDVTGDGRGDVLIGAPREDPGASPNDAGRAFLFNGATGAFIRVFASPSQEAGGNFGWSVAGVPDANNDGRGEILIGAPGDSPGPSPVRSGRAYQYSGATGFYLRTYFSPHVQSNGEFGACVAGLADATGDERGDVLIGAPRESIAGFAQAGRAYIINGATGALYRSLTSPSVEVGGRFGSSLGSAPDENAHCHEVLVGAPLEDPGANPSASGRAYIIRH